MKKGSEHMMFAHSPDGVPLSIVYDGLLYYYVTNIQGDVVAILDATGAEVVTYSYDAWGNIRTIGGSKATTLGQDNPLRYRGYVYDQETGLYYLQSRYYDPEMGRFINADAFTSTGQGFTGNNTFSYCNNNPIRYTDMLGCVPDNILLKNAEAYKSICTQPGQFYGYERGQTEYAKGNCDEIMWDYSVSTAWAILNNEFTIHSSLNPQYLYFLAESVGNPDTIAKIKKKPETVTLGGNMFYINYG